MYYVKHRTAWGHYLYVYPADSKSVFKELGYCWTLKREEATRFETGEAAFKKMEELKIDPIDADLHCICRW